MAAEQFIAWAVQAENRGSHRVSGIQIDGWRNGGMKEWLGAEYVGPMGSWEVHLYFCSPSPLSSTFSPIGRSRLSGSRSSKLCQSGSTLTSNLIASTYRSAIPY